MALLELNLEKPALKRVESDEDQQAMSESTKNESTANDQERESSDEPSTSTQQSGGTSRIRKYGRRVAILGGTAAGVAAARKFRQRQKQSDSE